MQTLLVLALLALTTPAAQAQSAKPHTAGPHTAGPHTGKAAKARPGSNRARPTRSVKNPVAFIEKRLVHLRLGFWGMSIKQGNRKLRTGFASSKMREFFFDDRLATKYFDAYRALFLGGFITSIVGLSTMLVSTVLLLPGTLNPGGSGTFPVMMVLMLAGITLGIVGPVLIGVSYGQLMKAIDTYNQGIFSRARRGKWKLSFQLRRDGGVVGVGTCF